MGRTIFLCCFCGAQIQSSRTNLDRHERKHASHVTKIKCAAKNCDLTFNNKGYYWTHWTQVHKDAKMPDLLIYTEETKKHRKAYTRKTIAVFNEAEGGNDDTAKHNVRSSGIDLKKPNDFDVKHANLDMENLIEECLVRDPFYGCLNDSNS